MTSDENTPQEASKRGVALSLGSLIFTGRWLIAPLYFGMLLLLGVINVRFVAAIAAAAPNLLTLEFDGVLVLVLKLIDLSLVGNLLIMVMLGGWENYVAPIIPAERVKRPLWIEHMDSDTLKLKVIGSITAIIAIDLLETYLDLHGSGAAAPGNTVWQLAIFLAFPLAGVLLALTDVLRKYARH